MDVGLAPRVAERSRTVDAKEYSAMKSPLGLAVVAIVLASAIGISGALESARQVPARDLPVPETVSPAIQVLIAGPPPPWWNAHPKSASEWKRLVTQAAEPALKALPEVRKQLGVKVEPANIGDVPVFVVTPAEIAPANEDRILLNFHSGGYVMYPGESGAWEAIWMAARAKTKTISVDYRMAPDFPYPAAMDDAMAVYRELLKTFDPKRIGVFGTSTGGGMTLALVLRAKAEGLPLPGAIAPGTPWSDMTKTGDSYATNERIDNVIFSMDGIIADQAALYAAGHDLKDPQLSPVYGDFRGFPPTILTTGTRDLFLSNTVRVHRKLREAGAIADLIVLEGQSHAQYLFAPSAPESQDHFAEVSAFFDRYLAK